MMVLVPHDPHARAPMLTTPTCTRRHRQRTRAISGT